MKHTQSRNSLATLLAAGLFLAVHPASAVLIVGTSVNDDTGEAIGARSGGGHEQWALGFTMPGQSYTLTDVLLRLAGYGGPGEAIVGIYSDNAGAPGALYALMNNPAAAGSPDDYTFTPTGTVTLTANTEYWLLADAPVDINSFLLYFWQDALDAPTGLATFNGYVESTDLGTSYSTQNDINLRFAINGTPITQNSVPDAGNTLPLLGVALAGLACFARRR